MLLEIFLPIFFILLIICISEKPKYFRKQFIILNKFLKNIEKKEKNHSSSNELKFYDLTPIDDSEEKACGKLLKFGLENEKVLNIAVTGPYGSGKSSFLKSFESKNGNYNYLNISLASFDDSVGNDKNTKNKIEKIIEENILQQIIYKESADKLPNSRIKRIKEIDFISFLSRIILLYIWLNIFYVKFKKEAWRDYESLFLDFNEGNLRMSLTLCLILGIIYFIYTITKNFGINKIVIKALDNEIELGNNKETSVFYKYLDEIIYFFKNTKYDVVFFEDIDRFENINVNLFTKLRELNGLLNSSNDIKRKIKFVYAVKDDLFENEDKEDSHKLRTKFFDLIVPIIPFVDYSNSTDEMIKNIWDNYLKPIYEKSNMNENIVRIKKRISNICLYINDMRVINNISNEFIIYRENINGKFETKVDDEKLLGYIVYKNLYPKDFSDLHNKKGMVYTALTDKSRIKEESLKNIPLIELLKRMNKKDIFNEDICKENILIEFLKDGIINEDYSLYISFFKEGKKTRNDIEFIRAFRKGEEDLFNYPIDNIDILIEEYLYEGDFNNSRIINEDILTYFLIVEIKQEEIKRMKENFFNLLNKNIGNKIKDITKIIDNINFGELLLNTFINNLLKNLPNLTGAILNNPQFNEEEKKKYLILFFDKVIDVNDIIKQNAGEPITEYFLKNKNVIEILQKAKLSKDRYSKIISKLNLKAEFSNVKEESEIFNYFYENYLYEINFENILKIVQIKCSLSEEEKIFLEVQPYTLITSKMNELEKLKDYLDNNIQEFVKNVILSKNLKVQESEDTLLKFYKLPEDILDNKMKKELIESQNNLINDITGLNLEIQNNLIEKRKFLINWHNINQNFICNKHILTDSVVGFFNDLENTKKISENHIASEGDYSSEDMGFLGRAIIKEDTIYDENYVFLINSLYEWDLPNLEEIPINKLKLLVKFNRIEFNSNNFEKIISISQESLIGYILNNNENFLNNFEIFNEILVYSVEFNSNYMEVYNNLFENWNTNEKIQFINNFSLTELNIKDKLWTQINTFINTLENYGLGGLFNDEKVEELLKADFLPITNSTVKILNKMIVDSKYSEVEGIIEDKKNELLENIKELDLTAENYEILFDVLNNNKDKFKLINNLKEETFKNYSILEKIFDFIEEEENEKIELAILEKLMSKSSKENQLNLFLKQLDFLSTSEIKKILINLEGNYKKIVNNPTRNTFNKNDVNIEILNKLKEKGIFSTVSEKNNKITVIKNPDLKW